MLGRYGRAGSRERRYRQGDRPDRRTRKDSEDKFKGSLSEGLALQKNDTSDENE